MGFRMTGMVMVQGTTSHAGKSVVVTGLCRAFRRMGIRVAPFKPQNMALNSAVTVDGGEIGRSQAVQALACGIAPHTDMNPVLLKPNSDTGAQIIINGQMVGNQDAREYHDYKRIAFPAVLDAFRRLSARHDLVVVEGAGSPAEINLRENDIANMGFATASACPVIIVADIDRGGVFAHLAGTMDCLAAGERRLVKGFLMNRFRGDKALLDDGLDWLAKKTGKPTLGILPFLKNLYIESEDSVDARPLAEPRPDGLRVVVPRLPRISNHTDLDALRLHPGVRLRFIEQGESIPPSDLVVLPGSKNTLSDLEWLMRNGWDTYLRRHLRYGGKLVGICGGYQMIGKSVHDPWGLEGPARSLAGLGLMEFQTTLARDKKLKNVSGRFHGTDCPVEGYEIHKGEVSGTEPYRPAFDLDGRKEGVVSPDDRILCTTVHGIFDNDRARKTLLQWAGLEHPVEYDFGALKEREIERVADMLEQHVKMEQVAEISGIDGAGCS